MEAAFFANQAVKFFLLYMVQYGCGFLAAQKGVKVNYTRKINHFVLIPILINGIGDGLAEPVGVRFGRHTYRVYALFSKRQYHRTLEGSACVFLSSLVIIAFHHDAFTLWQWIAALVLVPVCMTLAEAFSPHTWDTPFLFLTGYLAVFAVSLL